MLSGLLVTRYGMSSQLMRAYPFDIALTSYRITPHPSLPTRLDSCDIVPYHLTQKDSKRSSARNNIGKNKSRKERRKDTEEKSERVGMIKEESQGIGDINRAILLGEVDGKSC